LKSFSIRGAVLSLLLSLVAADAFAVPAFARRYKVECSFCHQIFPKLNRMGERFKERGYRLENEEKFEGSAWLRSVPVSGRLFGTQNLIEDREDRTTGYLKVLSAGSLGSKVSYWVDDAWLFTSDRTTHIKPDNAWARVDFKPSGKFYLKGGRFELDLPVTQTRSPHLMPYQIFGTNVGLESDNIGAYQDGVELGGEFGTTHLSIAVVNGRNNQDVVDLAELTGVGEPDKFDGNVFLRATKRMATSRFGAFAYIGRNELVARLNATQVGTVKDDILRLGIDGNVRFDKFHVYGVAMYGSNSDSLLTLAQPNGTGETLSFAGGFLCVDYHILENVALTGRYQVRAVDVPGALDRDVVNQFLPGVQAVIWKLKLSSQFIFSDSKVPWRGAIQVETAF
jgi:hypothetical protein